LTKTPGFIRSNIECLLVRAFSRLASALPEKAAYRLGLLLGRIIRAVDRRHRTVADENLAAAFPEKTHDEIRELGRRVYRHIGLIIVESLRVRLMLDAGLHRWVQSPDLADARAALHAGKGLIVVTAHIGNWEIAGHAASIMLTPLHSVARQLDNPLLERYIDEMRRLSGQQILDKRGAVRDMMQVLKNGGAVAILMDQDARRHGIFVNFFGRPASTWPTAAALSLRLGSPIVTGFVRRLDGQFRYELIADPVLWPQPTDDREADIRNLTQLLTSRIEAHIRECPEQWFWVHRRWKTQPPPKDQG